MECASAIWQQAAHTTYHPAAQQEPYKNAYFLTNKQTNNGEHSGKKSGEWTISRKMTRQKEDADADDDDDDDCFYIALFSALSSRLTALACDSTRVTSFL